MIFFLPIVAGTGFFAFPWKGEQSTEIWALAKLRFMVKPRIRIWDQDGVKDLVTVQAPKRVEIRRSYKDSLSQTEVRSRLKALADTIDSRGWATRNLAYGQQWARAVPVPGSTPVLSGAEADMFDSSNSVAQHFDVMLSQSSQQHRQRVEQSVLNPQTAASSYSLTYPSPQPPQAAIPQTQTQQPQTPQSINTIASNYWFANGPAYPTNPQPQPPTIAAPVQNPRIESDVPLPIAATPTPQDTQLAADIRENQSAVAINYGHMRVLQPAQTAASNGNPGTPPIDYRAATQIQPAPASETTPPIDTMTRKPDPAILDLASNDDLDIATIARQANRQIEQTPDEVEIRLH